MSKIKDELEQLVEKKLVTVKRYPNSGLNVYKYHRKVFFDNLWNNHKGLLKARGIVIDDAGNVVQNPFDKIFNYLENNAGRDIKPNDIVHAVVKENGFLGCVSMHKKEILCSTTGSLDSDFVGYIKDFITPEVEKNLKAYFEKNNNTLMFEVIHPKDPHIIEYPQEAQGLYLIGCRSKSDSDSPLVSEDELDAIAKSLNFRRPAHFNCTFEQLTQRIKSEAIEGYMVLSADQKQVIAKRKTNYYLVTKFIGRMGKNNIDLMYKNPKLFKEKIEEEFYPLVDYLVKEVQKDFFTTSSNEDKVVFIRGVINEIYNPKEEKKVAIKNK